MKLVALARAANKNLTVVSIFRQQCLSMLCSAIAPVEPAPVVQKKAWSFLLPSTARSAGKVVLRAEILKMLNR